MSDDTKAVVRDPTTQRGHQAFERLRLFSHVLNRYCFREDQPPKDEELDNEFFFETLVEKRKELDRAFVMALYTFKVSNPKYWPYDDGVDGPMEIDQMGIQLVWIYCVSILLFMILVT